MLLIAIVPFIFLDIYQPKVMREQEGFPLPSALKVDTVQGHLENVVFVCLFVCLMDYKKVISGLVKYFSEINT